MMLFMMLNVLTEYKASLTNINSNYVLIIHLLMQFKHALVSHRRKSAQPNESSQNINLKNNYLTLQDNIGKAYYVEIHFMKKLAS